MSIFARRGRWGRARRGVAWGLGVAAGASLALACASLIGIDERLPDDVTADGLADDRAVVGDGGPNVCPPSARCVDVPEGWQLASLDPDKRLGCADGYGTPEDLVVAADGLGCTCKCTETSPGSCAAPGTQTTFRDYPAAGCGASTATYPLDFLDGGCFNAAIPTTPYVRIPTAPSRPPACAADASPSQLQNGQACVARGMACKDRGICAGALAADVHLCVMKAGDVACPAGYEKKFQVGKGVGADTRRCGTCTCTPGTECLAPTVALFTGTACTKTSIAVPASGSCTATEAGVSYASYRYAGKAPSCQPSVPPLLDGGVTMDGPRTVCCEPRD